MIAHILLAVLLFLGILTLGAVPLGKFIARVFSAQSEKEINEPLYDHLFISKKEAKE